MIRPRLSHPLTVATLLCTVLVLGGLVLQASGNTGLIWDHPAAWFRAHYNELSLDAKQSAPHDPVKFRMGNWVNPAQGGYMGTISMDLLEGNDANPRRMEQGFQAMKLDSADQYVPLGPLPMVEYFLGRRAGDLSDADTIRAYTMTSQYHIWYVNGVPKLWIDKDGVHGVAALPPGDHGHLPQPPLPHTHDQLVPAGGETSVHIQGDGNFVVYRRNPNGSLGAPIWASQDVMARLAALEAKLATCGQ